MKINPVFHREANRKGVTDEMYVVAAVGEFLTQLGSHHTASAVSRIAGNSDLHISTTWCALESKLKASSRRGSKPIP